jgi:uncharacterized protein (TIGR04255 family)
VQAAAPGAVAYDPALQGVQEEALPREKEPGVQGTHDALKKPFGVLDLDHYSEYPEPEDYDSAKIIENLWELHDVVDQAFRKATTNGAKLDWK